MEPTPPPPLPRTGRLAQFLGSYTVPAALALFSALVAIPAFWTAGVNDHAVLTHPSGTDVLKEAYLDLNKVHMEYHDKTPRVVDLTVRDFNHGATIDLTNETQDYQTRYSPDITCSQAKKLVLAVYGRNACEAGSKFYQVSTQYERDLYITNQHSDPAIGFPNALSAADIRTATKYLRRAEVDLVACVVTSKESRPVNVTVSPAEGYVVEGDKVFTLDPHSVRRVILQPDQGLGGAAIGEAGCTVSYDLATQAKSAAIPRTWIVVAGLLALSSAAIGFIARMKGWKKD